jgi:hypothetical protein
MVGKRSRLPPDDIGEWHSVVIERIHPIVAAHMGQPKDDKQYHISVWLEADVSGSYYIKKSHPSEWPLQATTYCFKDQEDAMMFSMRFA